MKTYPGGAKTYPGGRRSAAEIRASAQPSKPTEAQRRAFAAGRTFEAKRARITAGGSVHAERLPAKVLRSQGQRRAFLAGRMFEAAKTTRVNSKHWAKATTLDANSTIGPENVVLRNRSRYEYYNNGYARGIVKTWSSDCIGQEGPALTVHSIKTGAQRDVDGSLPEDETFNDLLEWAWYDWCEVCDLSGQQDFADFFHSRLEELWTCGEFFVQLRFDGDGPITLRLLAIEPDRIQTPWGMLNRRDVRDGIKFDANGKPLEYYVLKRHPGDMTLGASWNEFDTVQARDMIHVYVKERPGQVRGYPWLGSTLEVWAQLRDFTTDTMLAARVAAMFSGFVYTDHSQLTFDDLAGELPVFDMEPGTLTTLPAGWKFAQSTPQHPSTTFREFKREMISEAGRPQGVPYLKIAADAAGHNYSSARFDDQSYWGQQKSVQGWLSRVLLRRLLRLGADELRLTGKLPRVQRWWPTWVWPAPRHVDPAKEAEGARGRMATLTTTYEAECMANGHDPDDVLRSSAQVARRCKALGLPDPFAVAARIPAAPLAPDEPIEPAPGKSAKKGTNADE